MNKRNRLKTIRPQNERAARAFRKKQNMKVELNKKWLPVVYVVMLGICILLNVTNDSLDPANVLISVCMFGIVGAIFVYAYKHLKHIDQMGATMQKKRSFFGICIVPRPGMVSLMRNI